MGLIANQMAVEMLCKMSKKLKRACSTDEKKSDKHHKDGNGKEQKS